MPKLTIDQREVEVPPGATILDAARKLGIDVPALCFLEGCRPSTSCLVCMVKVRSPASSGNSESSPVNARLVPACATAAADGLEVESETDEVHDVRKTSLELLLSDHLGDCLAPCWLGCPAHMDIPRMLRQIAAGDLRGAIETVKSDIALPAVLGRVCPKPCEKVCRRGSADGAVAICELKRYVADVDLASGEPYLPECGPSSQRVLRAAIIGGGPAGLSAAYYLRRQGHAVTIFDDQPQLGGRLRHETSEVELPREVLDAEIAQIVRLGVDVYLNARVSVIESQSSGFTFQVSDSSDRAPTGNPNAVPPDAAGGLEGSSDTAHPSLPVPQRSTPNPQPSTPFDSVLIACGAVDQEKIARLHSGLKATARGIDVGKGTYRTSVDGVFAAGVAVRGHAMVVRSVADGKEAAIAIDAALGHVALSEGEPSAPVSPAKPFNSRIGKINPDEMPEFLAGAEQGPRVDPPAASEDFTNEPEVARSQAGRCLHCDCRALADCKLRRYAAMYGADPHRFRGEGPRAAFRQDLRHADVIYEPGKCIHCGLCIEIAAEAGEPLGLTFIGRGFDVRVGVPFDRSLAEALAKVAARCVAACPTAALAMKKDQG